MKRIHLETGKEFGVGRRQLSLIAADQARLSAASYKQSLPFLCHHLVRLSPPHGEICKLGSARYRFWVSVLYLSDSLLLLPCFPFKQYISLFNLSLCSSLNSSLAISAANCKQQLWFKVLRIVYKSVTVNVRARSRADVLYRAVVNQHPEPQEGL